MSNVNDKDGNGYMQKLPFIQKISFDLGVYAIDCRAKHQLQV